MMSSSPGPTLGAAPPDPPPEKPEGPGAIPGGAGLFGVALLLATAIGAASTVLLRVTSDRIGTPLSWTQAATGWIDWYLWAALTPLVVWLARAVPVRADGWPRTVAAHVVFGAVICLAELALFALVMTGYNELFLHQELLPWGDRWVTLIGRWLPPGMLIYALIVAVITAVDHGRRARERDVRAARLEADLSRAQMHALQAQVQPHFLFNTLNTISMAVREDRRSEAVEMMARLSGILRRSIEAASEPETTLRRELDFLRHYLRLERCRMEDRLTVCWDVDEGVLDAAVPTMLLQPLVENAVRHGLADLPEGGSIAIRASRRDGALALRVEDDGAGLAPDAREGTGIGNVRRRLETRYGAQAGLTVTSSGRGGTTASLTLPLEIQDSSDPGRLRARSHR